MDDDDDDDDNDDDEQTLGFVMENLKNLILQGKECNI